MRASKVTSSLIQVTTDNAQSIVAHGGADIDSRGYGMPVMSLPINVQGSRAIPSLLEMVRIDSIQRQGRESADQVRTSSSPLRKSPIPRQ